MSELVVWSAASATWQSCPVDEITWLDRNLLSGGEDRSLHRAPRCPGLRYVHHRWELFSRDLTHQVYVTTFTAGPAPDHRAVQATAQHVLPAAQAALETQPVRLDAGEWLISVGTWVLPVCIAGAADGREQPAIPAADGLTTSTDTVQLRGSSNGGTPAVSDAMRRVTRYFEHNPKACMAMAYYYQDFFRGGFAPQTVPMTSVAIALDLNGEATVSEYKRELQHRIWGETGHHRELGEFLLVNGLIGQADLERAIRVAQANEASGRAEAARERMRYTSRKQRHREPRPDGGPRPEGDPRAEAERGS